MPKKTAYIGVGSNLGDKFQHCQEAISKIGDIPSCCVKGQSSFFKTEPVGVEDQDWFVNAVVSVSVGIPAQDLMQNLLAIETGMGRKREKKWDARPIDLDILLYGSEILKEENLIVPHPLMHERRFVLAPLVELAPHLKHPVTGETMKKLLDKLPASGQNVAKLRGL
jgi:2-amino-4-hydroxy-6-hydroxymethyldihydropteridine diphosphokinase